MSDKTVLVTGVTGFIARQCAIEFLKAGYRVRGTMRSLAKAGTLKATIGRHADISGLTLVEADLLSDTGWDAAMDGMEFVAHVASPFPLAQPKDENDLIRPAVEGTLRVMKAARKAGVRGVVQTSSIAAIAYGHGRHPAAFTAADWTVLDGPGVSAYAKSKTLAEKAARDFVASSAPDMHFSTVNPALVVGPVLDRDIGSSAAIVQMMMSGKYPALPRIKMPVVDVRDVAAMHRLALESAGASGGRYIACARSLWFTEMARILKDRLGADARRVPTVQLPDLVVRLIALFDKSLGEAVSLLGQQLDFDTRPGIGLLGRGFIPAEDAIAEMGRSLKVHGLV